MLQFVWFYYLCGCRNLREVGIRWRMLLTIPISTIFGILWGGLVGLVFFNGNTHPVPAFILLAPPSAYVVNGLLLIFVIRQTSDAYFRFLTGKRSKRTRKRFETQASKSLELIRRGQAANKALGNNSLFTAHIQEKGRMILHLWHGSRGRHGSWRVQPQAGTGACAGHADNASRDTDCRAARAPPPVTSEAAVLPLVAANTIHNAYCRWELRRNVAFRKTMRTSSIVRVFACQLLLFGFFAFMNVLVMTATPTFYSKVPGGEGTVAMAIPLLSLTCIEVNYMLAKNVNSALCRLCSHMYEVTANTFKITLFGTASTPFALVTFILCDVIIMAYRVMRIHPCCAKRIYNGSFVDSLWRRSYVLNKAMTLALSYLSKLSSIATWASCQYIVRKLWNKDQYFCMGRIDYDVAL